MYRDRWARHLLKSLVIVFVMVPALHSGACAQSAPDMKTLIDDLVAANRILYRQGVVDGFGHVSARHPTRPDRFLLSAAKAPGRVTAEDIMEFDLEGKPIDRRDRPIYSERFIHSEVYTEVNARMLLQAVMLRGPITLIDPEENKLIESGRGTQISGHSVDRTWQMWLEEASRATSEPPR
jgi:hypothetical protein